MTSTDIQQLQYAFSKAQERNEELSALLKASNASNEALVEMVIKHEATIAAVTAERDTANAKLATIPWKDLRIVFNSADADGYYNDDVAEWLIENGVTL